jgi:hypothetical protein
MKITILKVWNSFFDSQVREGMESSLCLHILDLWSQKSITIALKGKARYYRHRKALENPVLGRTCPRVKDMDLTPPPPSSSVND